MIFDASRDIFEVARNFVHFFAHESCGFCTPCRVGTAMQRDLMDKIADGRGSRYEVNELMRLAELMKTHQPLRPRPDRRQPVQRRLAQVPPRLREAPAVRATSRPPSTSRPRLAPARAATRRDDAARASGGLSE